jgi:hypothetical protein
MTFGYRRALLVGANCPPVANESIVNLGADVLVPETFQLFDDMQDHSTLRKSDLLRKAQHEKAIDPARSVGSFELSYDRRSYYGS